MESSNYEIRVEGHGRDVSLAKVKAALGDLFLGSRPYGQGGSLLVAVKRDPTTTKEAVRRLNKAGFETDED